MQQAERMYGLTSAIFTQVDELRKKHQAAGKDVITLSIGSPDMAPAPHIVKTLKYAVEDTGAYGYTLSKGIPEFLHAIASWYRRKYGVALDPATEIHSLIGSQEGLAHISLCLVNPGDVVLVPDPGYPIYSAGPLVAGANLYLMPLRPENAYLPDFGAIPDDVLKRTKIMILNYPNNPLAATAPQALFREAVDLAARYNFIICHDFAYSELVFDGYRPESFLSIPGAKQVGVEFHSLSKTFNMAGCRIGFIAGNPEIIEILGRLKSNFDYGIFYPLQKAGAAALEGDDQYVRATMEEYRQRRDILVDGLKKIGWNVPRPKATMYIWAPVPMAASSLEFTQQLLENTGVAVTPGNAFGPNGEGYVRIALVQPKERIAEAVSRIAAWLK